MEKNIVKQIKVQKILGEMLKENAELYEKILDSNISSYFNDIANLAMVEDPYSNNKRAKELLTMAVDRVRAVRKTVPGLGDLEAYIKGALSEL